MRTEIAIISALALVLSMPLAFAQTDFDETSNGTDSQFEYMVNQEGLGLTVYRCVKCGFNSTNADVTSEHVMVVHHHEFEWKKGDKWNEV